MRNWLRQVEAVMSVTYENLLVTEGVQKKACHDVVLKMRDLISDDSLLTMRDCLTQLQVNCMTD